MLTKEERNAIAERISEEFDFTENDKVYHRPSRTVCLDMVDGSGNGVVSLSEASIDKLVDSIHVSDKPAKTVNVRTRIL